MLNANCNSCGNQFTKNDDSPQKWCRECTYGAGAIFKCIQCGDGYRSPVDCKPNRCARCVVMGGLPNRSPDLPTKARPSVWNSDGSLNKGILCAHCLCNYNRFLHSGVDGSQPLFCEACEAFIKADPRPTKFKVGQWDYDWSKYIGSLEGPAEILPIVAPPCVHCKFWKPHRRHNADGTSNGIVCCTAADMCHDFSCFRSKE